MERETFCCKLLFDSTLPLGESGVVEAKNFKFLQALALSREDIFSSNLAFRLAIRMCTKRFPRFLLYIEKLLGEMSFSSFSLTLSNSWRCNFYTEGLNKKKM